MSKHKKKNGNNVTFDKNFSLKTIKPLTDKQQDTFQEYERGQNLVLYGSAGTGKTYLALYLALRDLLTPKEKPFNRIIIVRSAVPTRDMGFLPGNEKEKTAIFEAPYKHICANLFGRDDAYEILKVKGYIQFLTTSYIRGLTLSNSIIIADEIQNMNDEEINTVVTRIGFNSKLILCGDTAQCDLFENKDENISGMFDLIRVAQKIPEFSLIHFDVEDIVRNGLIKNWIMVRREIGLI